MYDYMAIVALTTLLCVLSWFAGHWSGGRAYRSIMHQQRAEIDRLADELRRWTDRDARGRFVRREPK